MRLTPFAIVLAASIACGSPGTAPDRSGVHRVLFVGNSYLYYEDIPGIVQALSDSGGGDRLEVATVAGADMALIDHWYDGTARRRVDEGGWAWVVLQQGPSSVEINRDTLRLATRLFADAMSRVRARPALFSAWPSADRRQDFDRAIESYRLAATDVNGVFLPVASAWLAAWKRDPTLELYLDGLHPSVPGAYLSALVIYATLLDKSPVGLPSRLRLPSGEIVSVNPAVAELLQQAAAEVTRLSGAIVIVTALTRRGANGLVSEGDERLQFAQLWSYQEQKQDPFPSVGPFVSASRFLGIVGASSPF